MDETQTTTVDRRTFLTAAGCAVAAAAAPRLSCLAAAEPAANASWKMRLSTSTVHFSSLPIEDVCQRIAALGFEGIDIWCPSRMFGCPQLDEVEKRLGPAGLTDLLATHKLKLYSFTCYFGVYPRYADLFGKVGGGVAVRESGDGEATGKDLTARMKAFLEKLKPELDLAEKHNAYLAAENHTGRLLNSRDSFKAFVDLNRHPRLGIALAPYHLQAGNISVEEVIGICGKQLLYFYAWQHQEGVRQLPGVGPTDFTPWIAALAKADYAWYVNPFMHGVVAPAEMSKGLATAKEYLTKCYAKAMA
jgi:sugar phosphate isomerase/epimerase